MTDRWLSDDEQRIWRAYLRSFALLQARLSRQLQRDVDISEGDYAVLVNLSEAPDSRMRGFALAAVLQWEKSRLSHHLTRMERRGLVRREECPTDKRGAYVVLTDEGRERIETAAPMHVAEVRRWFVDVLAPEQLAALGEITTQLLGGLEPAEAACAAADLAESCPEADEGCGNI
jgi:DNA-binding MarR family transcriptional regulator